MNIEQWIDKAVQHQAELRELVDRFYPEADKPAKSMPITAPNPESASRAMREIIANRSQDGPSAVRRFDIAIQARDFSAINEIIGGAWIGVPESTACWQVRGFKECVELLEDPPEEPNENNQTDHQ